MARRAPAFQFYADDFLAGTIDMSPSEVGIYIRLLCLQWNRGKITDREVKATGGSQEDIEYVLSAKFEKTDGGWVNPRLEEVRAVSAARRESGSRGGSKTQANRQANVEANLQANPQAKLQAKSNPPTPSPSPTPINSLSLVPAELQADWERWLEFRFAMDGQRIDGIRAESVLMDLTRRGIDKAKRDIEFSILKGAKSVLDSDHDFQRSARAGTGGGSRRVPTLEEGVI